MIVEVALPVAVPTVTLERDPPVVLLERAPLIVTLERPAVPIVTLELLPEAS